MEEYLKDSLFINIFLVIVAVALIMVVIFLVVTCRKTIIPRCPSLVQDIVKKIEMKLMFNSVLRALLETYLLMAVSVFTEISGLSKQGLEAMSKDVESYSTMNQLMSFGMLLYLILLPVIVQIWLRRKGDDLRFPTTRGRYNSLF